MKIRNWSVIKKSYKNVKTRNFIQYFGPDHILLLTVRLKFASQLVLRFFFFNLRRIIGMVNDLLDIGAQSLFSALRASGHFSFVTDNTVCHQTVRYKKLLRRENIRASRWIPTRVLRVFVYLCTLVISCMILYLKTMDVSFVKTVIKRFENE